MVRKAVRIEVLKELAAAAGRASRAALTPEERSAAARHAVSERWRKWREARSAAPELSAAPAYLDPDFRRDPRTSNFCVRCQKDIENVRQAVRVTVDWSTWQVTLGGDHLLGRDCAKQIGLRPIGKGAE